VSGGELISHETRRDLRLAKSIDTLPSALARLILGFR